MVSIGGVHLLPATGEFAYDTLPHTGALAGGPQQPLNTFFAPGGTKTDYSYAIDQLQAAHPECTTVSLVVAWFFNSEAAGSCNVYPSTNYPLGAFEQLVDGVWTSANWAVSSLTQADFRGSFRCLRCRAQRIPFTGARRAIPRSFAASKI